MQNFDGFFAVFDELLLQQAQVVEFLLISDAINKADANFIVVNFVIEIENIHFYCKVCGACHRGTETDIPHAFVAYSFVHDVTSIHATNRNKFINLGQSNVGCWKTNGTAQLVAMD